MCQRLCDKKSVEFSQGIREKFYIGNDSVTTNQAVESSVRALALSLEHLVRLPRLYELWLKLACKFQGWLQHLKKWRDQCAILTLVCSPLLGPWVWMVHSFVRPTECHVILYLGQLCVNCI